MSSQTKVRTRTVAIIYNGDSREFAYNPHQAVQALLRHAIKVFGITANQHLMSLYDTDGNELPDDSSIEDAGVEPGSKLVLRQSVVKGG